MALNEGNEQRRGRMSELLMQLAPNEGYTLTRLEGVRIMRSNHALPRTPVLYEPSIVVVCQGRKRGFLDGKMYIYDAQQYLVLSLPLAFESETEATGAEPMLAVSIRINLQTAAELALAFDQNLRHAAAAPVGICSTPLDDRLGDAVLRLLEALTSPLEAGILGPDILREIHFRVLNGEQGAALRAALAQQSHFSKVGRALRRIHAQYHAALDVETLASEAGMSPAAFHTNFKAVTSTSPIQYVKATRLHKARLLMVQEGVSAATAANRVGYESASQFSREFKRFFGRPPLEEAMMMKNALIEVPAQR